jgi:HD-like signal output (HDOD) protein
VLTTRKNAGNAPNALASSQQATQIRIAAIRDSDLPTISHTMTRALSVVNSPDSTLQDLITVVQLDGALTTAILKLANSPVYCRQRTVERASQAVVLLGMKTCKQVITSLWMRSTFSSVSPTLRTRCDLIYKHSCLTASLASSINHHFALGFRGEEFSAALLHDLGRLLIAVAAPQLFDQADPMTFREDDSLLNAERTILGLDHCSLGESYANRFNFPESIVRPIALHHSPTLTDRRYPIVSLVCAADHLATHISAERKIRNYDPLSNAGWRALCRDPQVVQTPVFLRELSRWVIKAMRETRAIFRAAPG